MSTAVTEPSGIDPQVLADLDAVMKRIIDGTPVDPEVSRRIEGRADAHGLWADVDVQGLGARYENPIVVYGEQLAARRLRID